MGIPVMIMGFSGSGKSASLRNFKPGEIGVFSVARKLLPFRSELNNSIIKGADYGLIKGVLAKKTLNCYAIDDSQYLMAFESFRRAKEVGYGKFTDYAVDFKSLIDFIITQTPDDTIVYLLHHAEETDSGRLKAKTIGKMLDNQLTLEGMFTIVLMAESENGKYFFRTRTQGFDTVKSPMGMFEEERIDNDLKVVDNVIRSYYNLEKEGK